MKQKNDVALRFYLSGVELHDADRIIWKAITLLNDLKGEFSKEVNLEVNINHYNLTDEVTPTQSPSNA